MDIGQYAHYMLYVRERSPRTVKSNKKDLKIFERYFKSVDETLTWEDIDTDIIRNWVESMLDKGNAATTVNKRLGSVRMFYHFAYIRGFISHNPARIIKGVKKKATAPVPEGDGNGGTLE